MTAQTTNVTKESIGQARTGQDARAQLLSMMPVTERQIELAGVSTVADGKDLVGHILVLGLDLWPALPLFCRRGCSSVC